MLISRVPTTDSTNLAAGCKHGTRGAVGLESSVALVSSQRQGSLRRRSLQRRGGFTLLEVMIATAVTLLMMLSLAQIFKVIGDSMQRGRAILELNNRLRTVTHRIRSDLANLTINPAPPANPAAGQGYLEYYDGPMTDFTTATNPLTSASSRIGDCDDILMGTIKAKDTWFTGKVPQYVLTGDLKQMNYVTIAAQYAELVIFAQPQVAIANAVQPTWTNPDRNPSFLIGNSNFYQDDNGDLIPDTYRLHYRLLLIRPDLNNANGVLYGAPGQLKADQNRAFDGEGNEILLPTPHCDMTSIHNFCDLSVRRVFDGDNTTSDFVAANSLADLSAPENRFAHIQVGVGRGSTSMPVLALANAISPLSAQNGTLVGSGFLHPAFVLQGDRLGEDLLATDVVAFDVKGFDEGVPLLLHRGQNTTDESGAAGTDDLVLSPNDPGYASLLQSNRSYTPTAVGTGEFVDLAWGHKTYARITGEGGSLATDANVTTQLSAISAISGGLTNSVIRSGTVLTQTSNTGYLVFQPRYDTWSTHYEGDGILQAQLASLNGVVRVNGARDLYGVGTDDMGNLRTIAPAEAWRRFAIDAGSDGIDNAGTVPGVDDSSELETSAPYNVPLRGIQITVRMEDPRTRQVRQMSVAREFVNK